MQSPSEPNDTVPPWSNGVLSSLPSGDLVELVYLAHVVHWLMESQRWPFAHAARALHDKLTGFDPLVLYQLRKGGEACEVGAADSFGLDVPRPGRRIYSRGIGPDGMPIPPPPPLALPAGVTPGKAAALCYLLDVWGGGRYDESVMELPASRATGLAMSCEQATRLWQPVPAADGVLTFDDLKRFRIGESGKEWTSLHRAVLLKEYEARCAAGANATKAQESLARDLGLKTRQAIRAQLDRAIAEAKEEEKKRQQEGWTKGLGTSGRVRRIK